MKGISFLGLLCLIFGLVRYAAATTYYVSSSGGSDANTGTSPQAPWQSIARVNRAAMTTGDNVYFRVGDEWEDEFLSIGWSGSAGAHSIVGAYTADADGAVTFGPGPGNQLPVINDHYQWYGEPFTVVTGQNPGVDISGSFIDLENIEVKQSGWGVRIRGETQQAVTLDNVFVNGAYQCGMEAEGVTALTIQHSQLYNAEAFHGIFNQSGNWCSTIGIQHSHDILVQDNDVHESWGEGINVFYGSSQAIVRNNLLYANQAVGIYMGALNGAAVYGNLILGTQDPQYWRTSLSDGPGIALDNESYEFAGGATSSRGEPTGEGSLCPLGPYGDYAGTGVELCPDALQNVQIYDNLVAGTAAGLAVWFADYSAAYTGISVFNNTFVDNEQQLYLGGQRAASSVVRNNIFLSLSPGMVDVAGSNYGMTFDTNYWSQGHPPTVGDQPYSSGTDVSGGAQLAKMSAYRGISAADPLSANAFVPARSSSTLGRGSEQGLFFSTDYFGAALRDPLDLGAIAGWGASSATTAPTPPTGHATTTVNTATPNPASPGAAIAVSGSFTATTSAPDAVFYFWLIDPTGGLADRTSVAASFVAGVPTSLGATLTLPAGAVPGTYVITAGGYQGLTPLRPFIDDFASIEVNGN